MTENVRCLKLRMYEVEGLYYIYSIENKGADELRGYREDHLRLWFRIMQRQVFSCRGSVIMVEQNNPRLFADKPGQKVQTETRLSQRMD